MEAHRVRFSCTSTNKKPTGFFLIGADKENMGSDKISQGKILLRLLLYFSVRPPPPPPGSWPWGSAAGAAALKLHCITILCHHQTCRILAATIPAACGFWATKNCMDQFLPWLCDAWILTRDFEGERDLGQPDSRMFPRAPCPSCDQWFPHMPANCHLIYPLDFQLPRATFQTSLTDVSIAMGYHQYHGGNRIKKVQWSWNLKTLGVALFRLIQLTPEFRINNLRSSILTWPWDLQQNFPSVNQFAHRFLTLFPFFPRDIWLQFPHSTTVCAWLKTLALSYPKYPEIAIVKSYKAW